MMVRDKVALVTGCKQGIGYEVSVTLAENGADIVLNDVQISEDDSVVQAVKKTGRRVLCISADVSNPDDVENMFEKIKENFGSLHILANNAGITRDAMSHKMTIEQWNQVLAVNLTGTFLCAREAAKLMAKSGGGQIINFSSLAGARGNIGQANYVATKAAVIGLTKTLAMEYAKNNIRVNAVAPGFVDTPMTQSIPDKVKEGMIARIPMQRMGTAKDIAKVVLFLASPLSDYITGQTIHVNGGAYM